MDLELGIGLGRLDDIAASAKRAESLGYDYVSTGEHVFFYGPIGNGFISLSVAAGATTTIRLMSTITLAPLYPPALLAKLVSALDVASNGRFSLGIGVGGEYAAEFEACGVPVNERGARTDEALEILELLFSGDRVDFDGRFTQMNGVALSPTPAQEPGPPVWVSGRSDAAMRRAARFGNGWLPYMYTPEQLAASRETISGLAADFGREAPRTGQFVFFAVHEDRERAIAMAAERLSKQYNQDFSKLVHKYAVAGDPDDCVARLGEYVAAGARTIILNSACESDYVERNEELMAEAVLPRLRAL